MDRLGLDKGRPRVVPGGQASFALGSAAMRRRPQHPGDLDVLAMRAKNAPASYDGLGKTKQEAVIDIGQADARPLLRGCT